MTGMTDPARKPRWYRLTPDRLIAGLLAVEGFLLFSERFQWFAFNRQEGRTVLIALAAVGTALALMLLWFLASLVLRRRVQFGIRSLLVLTVAVAVPCSWLGAKMRVAVRESEAAAAIQKIGGDVYYRWELDGRGDPIPSTEPPEPAWLWNLLGDTFFDHVVGVSLENSSDAELETLKPLRQLEFLVLLDPADRALEHLEGLNELQSLTVLGGHVTNADLEHLKGLKKLRHLTFMLRPDATDEEIDKLRQALPNCEITTP
jgi:hypothetical protein